jgi:8-oxo-dGTP pyrophosphatase MutT (NUDIX family)
LQIFYRYPTRTQPLPLHQIRHFTATGFVVYDDATLLHWHTKVQEWLPPGGHIELNEDPVQATLREIKEETGFDVEIVPTKRQLRISNLTQVHPPFTIMVEDVVDIENGEHQHIDHIYFTRLCDPDPKRPEEPDGWHWITLDQLKIGRPIITPDGSEQAPPEDVQRLGEAAIRHVSDL